MGWYYSDDYLEHHGILGQKWGVRRFQRPDGTRTAAGKARQAENAKKSGLTDEQKKYLKIGAAVVGASLVAAGGVYLAKSGKLQAIGDKFVKKELPGKEKDILGLDLDDSFVPTSETAIKCSANINPSYSRTNCGSCSSAVLLNLMGGDYEALPEVPEHMRKPGCKGYDPAKLIECFEGAKWSDRQPPKEDYTGNRKKVSNAIESAILSQGDGAKGFIYCEAQVGNKPGHYFAYAVLGGKIHVLEGQPPSGQSTGIDYHTNFYDEVGKLFDVQDGANGVYFARLDNCPVKEDRIGDLAKKRK